MTEVGQLTAEDRARVFKALSDPRRVEIIDRLASGRSMCGTALANALGISLALLSHHSEVLMEAGLLRKQRVGKLRVCTLDLERCVWPPAGWVGGRAPRRPARRRRVRSGSRPPRTGEPGSSRSPDGSRAPVGPVPGPRRPTTAASAATPSCERPTGRSSSPWILPPSPPRPSAWVRSFTRQRSCWSPRPRPLDHGSRMTRFPSACIRSTLHGTLVPVAAMTRPA